VSGKKHYALSGMKIIGIYGVVKNLGLEKITAVDNLNLEVNRGEILTILGPSGCGKTTTLRLIAGFEAPNNGTILINGMPVAGDGVFVSPEKRNVGIVLQEFALFPHLNVRRNIAFGLRGKSRKEVDDRVQQMIDLTGLQGFEERFPYQLSGGQQQRVALARALAPSPLIVLFDEPFASIDPDLRSRMRTDLRRILKEAGVTAIFVTHDQEEAFLIADRIVVMNKGKIHQIGTPMEVYYNPHDRFVAEFVGHADFIPGTINSTNVITEIGEFPLNSNRVEPGTPVSVMLRPSDIDVVPTESGIGTIEVIEFKGEETVYSVRLSKSGTLVHSSQRSSYVPSVGTKVNVVVNPAHLVVFKQDGMSALNEIPVTL
jgi:iron(III) transport system ATP-binding protein